MFKLCGAPSVAYSDNHARLDELLKCVIGIGKVVLVCSSSVDVDALDLSAVFSAPAFGLPHARSGGAATGNNNGSITRL